MSQSATNALPHPPPTTHPADKPYITLRPSRGFIHVDLSALWQYRELLYMFVWRDVKVRYKQTLLGAAWVVFQPLCTMLVFTAVFSVAGQIPSAGYPYPLFLYAGLLPWFYISQALGRSAASLVSDAPLIGKIYFPRLILPIAAMMAPLLDALFAFLTYIGLMLWLGMLPSWHIVSLPLVVMLACVIALAGGLWLSALYVRYRDIGHIIPMFLQLWMFLSPIVYPVNQVPEAWRTLYALNPVVSVVEGMRWALLPDYAISLPLLCPSLLIVGLALLGGLIYFRNMERTFADVI